LKRLTEWDGVSTGGLAMSVRRIISLARALLLVTFVLIVSSCSLVGYKAGSYFDTSAANRTNISDLDSVESGDHVELCLANGETIIAEVKSSAVNDSLYLEYFKRGAARSVGLHDAYNSENVVSFREIKQQNTGRRIGATFGAVIDLSLLYVLIALSLFNPSAIG
jgi:hypothetical protein